MTTRRVCAAFFMIGCFGFAFSEELHSQYVEVDPHKIADHSDVADSTVEADDSDMENISVEADNSVREPVFWDGVIGIATIAAVFMSGISLIFSLMLTKQLHHSQRRDSQNLQLIPIWREMLELRRIDHKSPNAEDMRHTLNLLQFVERCYCLEIADREVLKETFGEAFVNVCDDISLVNGEVTIAAERKKGCEFLKSDSSVNDLYRKWKNA